MRKSLILIVSGGLAALLAGVAWFSYGHFFAFREDIQLVLASVPASEARPPPLVRDVVTKVEGDKLPSSVTRALLVEIHEGGTGAIERFGVDLLWSFLTPLTLNESELLALYLHYLPFEGDRGLKYGAFHYFGKTPTKLTRDEILGLLVIAKAPTSNSPAVDDDRFNELVGRLRSVYLRSGRGQKQR